MASLVSAGVSVTITDESFYIPATAATVPLMFVATRANKTQADGSTLASGTAEHSVIRTVTSIGQSISLYGVPYFWKDASDSEFHGDARNEYGLLALNQFLGVGARAYVVRANVDLKDAAETFVGFGIPEAVGSVTSVVPTGAAISAVAVKSALIKPEKYSVVFTSPTSFSLAGSNSGIIGTGSCSTVANSVASFTSAKIDFSITTGNAAFSAGDYFEFETGYVASAGSTVSTDGTITEIAAGSTAVPETWTITFTSANTYDVAGSVSGAMQSGTVGTNYNNGFVEFIVNAGNQPFIAAEEFVLVAQQYSLFNPLGANDAAKRVAIATALAAEINSNQDVRSEIYEYNLIVCPGYPEVADELVALSVSVNEEAFVISGTPMFKTPEQTKAWASTSERQKNNKIAYYTPGGLISNLDGREVYGCASGIALRTYAYNDNVSYVWDAPAGLRRGVVTGVSAVGYLSGAAGSATTFVECSLNQGQRDALYEFGTNINPIVNFPTEGILVWGQKTSQGAASALDRVNVMRLLMYIKRQLRKGSMSFVFQPNDKITWADWKLQVDSFLSDVLAKRGLYDFATQCDETTNTPTRIQNNQMWLNVGLKPTLTAEFLYIPIKVVSTGAEL